jgi:predicted Zn-ribbon and HTH transcriptional regulator
MPSTTGLGDILNKTAGDLGLFPKAQKYRVFSIWHKVVGEVSRQARPRRLQGDVLFVATASSVWSQELTFMRQVILSKLNHALGGEYIREIRFSEHLWGAQEGSASPGAGPGLLAESDSGSPERAVAGPEVGGDIDDPSLSRAVRKVAASMARRKGSLLARGYQLCRKCGYVYRGDKRECPACRAERESRAYLRAIAILDKQPELGTAELAMLADVPDPWLAERARREVESRLLSRIGYRLGAPSRAGSRASKRGAAARAELVEAVRRLASLRSMKPAGMMSLEELENAVGRRLAAVLSKE